MVFYDHLSNKRTPLSVTLSLPLVSTLVMPLLPGAGLAASGAGLDEYHPEERFRVERCRSRDFPALPDQPSTQSECPSQPSQRVRHQQGTGDDIDRPEQSGAERDR
jgi:hypothetical protein